jgi:hypothetical protein
VIDPSNQHARAEIVRMRAAMRIWRDFALANLTALASRIGLEFGSVDDPRLCRQDSGAER